jgi:hypothetical protein
LCLNKRHAIQMRVDVGFSFFTHSQSGQQMWAVRLKYILQQHYMKFHVLNISDLINLLAGSLPAIQYFYSCSKSN